jgi:hypothetical protein
MRLSKATRGVPQCKPKRNREDELDPVVLPELQQPGDSLVAPSEG